MAETGKSFINKFIGFSLSTWISFALSFITAPVSTRLFAPEVLGKINIFNTYSNLFGVLVLIGLDQAYVRFFHERPNNKSLGYLFTFCFSITQALIVVLFVLSLPVKDFISLILFQETDNLLYYLFFLSVLCSATLRYLNLTYRMEKNIKLYTIQGVLMTLVSKVLYIGVGFWDSSYKPALIVLTISHVILALIFLLIQYRCFTKLDTFDKFFSAQIFKFALPLIPVSVLAWANSSIPQIVIQHTMDYHNVGIFTSALALANLILVIQAGFNTFWVPYTYENYKTQTGQFFKIHRYLVCVLTIFSLLIICSQDVIFLLLGEKYRAAKSFFPYLILTPVCYVIGEVTGVGINISKKTYLNLIVFGISVISNLIFSLLLNIPLGVAGVAIAVSIAAIISLILKTYLGEKHYHVVDSYRYMISSIFLIIGSATITLFISNEITKYILLFLILLFSIIIFRKEIMELYKYSNNYFVK